MKKESTEKSHYEQINLALAHIHCNFYEEITAEDLAKISGYSIFHFHRIFKEITNESVNDYLRNSRLEKASNLLLYNQHQSIEEIALGSGFKSGTAFTAAFKKMFKLTPNKWRKSGYDKILFEKKSSTNKSSLLPEAQIIKNKEIPMLYIRVDGYLSDMTKAWKELISWAKKKNVLKKPHKFIGLFHNNPVNSDYKTSRFFACLQTQEEVYRNGQIGKCVVSSGLFAKFTFKCNQEELYELMKEAYSTWLPNSTYELRNFPAYVEYKSSQELLENKPLEIDFYMPIQELS